MLFIPESLSPRTVQSSTLDRKGAGEVAEVHTNTSATLGRQRLRSRIPTAHARHHAASPATPSAKMARSVSESELGTESVDQRLETLLHLLGGSRPGSIANRSTSTKPNIH